MVRCLDLSASALTEVIRDVASRLGNTPSVCRKCYIHPAILGAHDDDADLARWEAATRGKAIAGLTAEESALLRFLGG